jgi:NAD-dependent deacetylase
MNFENAVFVTGAGISVESGIRPFRGTSGIWEENPMEMATFRKFITEPAAFLSWYYKRFVSCRNAMPNPTHELLSKNGYKVITQNVDGLHRKADHPETCLIEIHGYIEQKRKVDAISRSELTAADWDQVDESNLVESLFDLFQIDASGEVDPSASLRPHILLFDEYYTELYQIEKAMDWVDNADMVVFMGTSNAVGITEGILSMAVRQQKQVVVVDPSPVRSLCVPGASVFEMSASQFCKENMAGI